MRTKAYQRRSSVLIRGPSLLFLRGSPFWLTSIRFRPHTAVRLRLCRLGNFQILANLSRQQVVHFGMTWHRRPLIGRGISPPRVIASLANKPAAMLLQVLQEGTPLHTVNNSSEYPDSAAERASARLNSKASWRISRSDCSKSALVFSCAFTPGTSSIHPIHQSPSFLTMAVYVEFITAIYSR